MATTSPSRSESHHDLPWHIIGRWQEYEGEARANLLRVIGIAAFYAIELVNYHGVSLGFLELPRQSDVTPAFHRTVTALAIAWTMLGLGIHICLQRRIFPASLKYISTGCDLLLLTMILIVADGPRSPLVVGYLLLVALSALRFNLRLIQCTTIGAMVGYLVVSGFARWYADRDVKVPRYQQAILLLAVGLTGIVIGQIVRRVRTIAQDYAQRSQPLQGE